MPDERRIETTALSAAPVQPKPLALPPAFSTSRLIAAFAVAGVSDAVGAFFTWAPPIVVAVDLLTALLLFAVLGWSWLLLPGLILEAIPGVDVIPFWLLVVAAIAVWGTPRPKITQLKK